MLSGSTPGIRVKKSQAALMPPGQFQGTWADRF